jgi:TetR/AcrR family transcriptional repressor of nem operon
MARDGTATKQKILEAGERLLLEYGYGGMSLDQVIEAAGITKGAFFYHFKSKNVLAQALLNRYVRNDEALLHDLVSRAEGLHHDPLQQYLIFVGLFVEMLRDQQQPPPGCLVASYIYQLESFDAETKRAVVKGFDEWSRVLGAKLEAAFEKSSPRLAVTVDQILDNLLSAFEGGLIMSKIYGKSSTLADQIAQHKNYVELLFSLHDD